MSEEQSSKAGTEPGRKVHDTRGKAGKVSITDDKSKLVYPEKDKPRKDKQQ